MLIVYLDQNVYQDLKKEENEHLVQKIQAAKEYLLIVFSEAHLYDLSRDKTDEKFNDMDFIASIAANNCLVFTDRTEIINCTAREYYDSYDWSNVFDIEDIDDPIWELMKGMLKTIPVDFKSLLNGVDLPSEVPDSIRSVLLKPINMYDLMVVMIDWSETLSNEQKEFKQLIQYLHSSSLKYKMYEAAGISGYDGENITDRGAFYDSYIKKFIPEGQSKTRYEVYTDMYNGLEFYGFVKGRPKKQRMMNLINDAKHSFFGTVCDVVISKDVDFLEKTRFMNKAEGYEVKVLPYEELESFLDEQARCAVLTIETLFSEIVEPFNEEEVFYTDEEDGLKRMFVELKNSYYSYFNIKAIVFDEYGNYWTIYRKPINYNNSPLKLQLRYIVTRLILELGEDLEQKGEYTFSEQVDEKSIVRTWIIDDIIIDLILDRELYLKIYDFDYFKKRREHKEVKVD
jgi:hypothetical protein